MAPGGSHPDEPPAKRQCVDAERTRGLMAIVGITLVKRGSHSCHDTCQLSDIAGKATYPSAESLEPHCA